MSVSSFLRALIILGLALAVAPLWASTPRNVLVLIEDDLDSIFPTVLQTHLIERSAEAREQYATNLVLHKIPTLYGEESESIEDRNRRIVEQLDLRFENPLLGRHVIFDEIIAQGTTSAEFLDAHPARWPDAERSFFHIAWQPKTGTLYPTDFDPALSFKAITAAFPDIRQVVLLYASFETGKINDSTIPALFEKAAGQSPYKERFDYAFWNLVGLEPDELHRRANTLTQDTALIYVDYRDNNKINPEAYRWALDESPFPVFGIFKHNMGRFFGGAALTPTQMADAIYAKATGQKTQFGPEDVTTIFYDYDQLQSYDVSMFQLPEDAVILNSPQPVRLTTGQLYGLGSAVVIMIVGAILMVRLIRLNRELVAQTTAASIARSSQQAESRFLSNMSHEIRNPLNGIKGILDHIASDETTPPQIKEDVGHALVAAEHLHQIVDDILDLKALDEDKIRIDEEPYDLHGLLISTEANRRFPAQRKGVEFRLEYSLDNLPRFVIGDKKRWYQLTANIVGNALKFTETGSVVERLHFADGWLTVTVTDTGVGMSPETLSKLFNRFEQGESGINKRFGGSGLGLAICKGIVDAMGGTISVESELGKGSTFVIRAPLKVDTERERLWRAGRLDIKAEPSDGKCELTGTRILCVDDSSINLKVVARPLARAGASVTTVLSAKEALEQLDANDFDIVLTDISMPDMDGEQLQQILRQTHPELPIVAITGNVLRVDVQRYLKNGFVAALGKPLDVQTLCEVVRQYASHPVNDKTSAEV